MLAPKSGLLFALSVLYVTVVMTVSTIMRARARARASEQENYPRPWSEEHDGSPVSGMYQPGFDVDPAACHDDVEVVVVIHSAPQNKMQRSAIRRTWGVLRLRRDVVVVFLLGTSLDEALTRNVRKESQTYGDVIVSRNVDSYDNMTLKTVAMSEWVSHRCPKARFFLKTDDDVFLNVPRFLEFLLRPEVLGASRTVIGELTRGLHPIRTPGQRLYVSEEEYSGDTFPDYIQGPCYLVTGDLSLDLYQASLQSKFFRLEDIFFTGLVAEVVGARRVGLDNFCTPIFIMKSSTNSLDDLDTCDVRSQMAIHLVNSKKMFRMWRILLGGNLKC